MKKHVLLVVSSFFVMAVLHAQIPNASFESWASGDPVGWFTGNAPGFEFVSQSATAHDGTKAVKCNVVKFGGNFFASPFALGNTAMGVHTSTAPEAIHGWYQFNSEGNDVAYCAVEMVGNNQLTGAGTGIITPSSVYKEFVANIYYTGGSPTGDSILIFFFMGDTTTGLPHQDTYLILDDLSFGALSAVNEINNKTSGIEMISPNPANDNAEIVYFLQTSGKTKLDIYDITGRLINSLVDEKQFPGRYKVEADVSSLTPGAYFCRLTTDTFNEVRKVQVVR